MVITEEKIKEDFRTYDLYLDSYDRMYNDENHTIRVVSFKEMFGYEVIVYESGKWEIKR